MEKSSLKVTVIVPIYQQWDLVHELFNALLEQDFPKEEWELLLVDNGSKNVPEISSLPGFVKLLKCDKSGSYAARNAAIKRAKGELLVFTDSDCVPSCCWLSLLWAAYQNGGHDKLLAGGVKVSKFGSGKPNIIELYDKAMGLPQARYVSRGYAVTANLSLSLSMMKYFGGFDEERFSGGDAELCQRATKENYELIYLPEAFVEHPARSSFKEIARKLKRVKGGQICAGGFSRRLKFFIKTFVPPVWAYWYIVSCASLTGIEKIKVLAFQTFLWGVELIETISLIIGKAPERR
ncbi:glycosyltransferase family 2 protein [Halomonas sp. B23F22_10]|uniref:glycosyltransferase family 2 protein n=1 Tax=Halomonas sp. B23F22_10 TaxID=3459515 RepID=UPI00373E4587